MGGVVISLFLVPFLLGVALRKVRQVAATQFYRVDRGLVEGTHHRAK